MSMTPSSAVVVGGMRGKAVGYLWAYRLLRLFEPINQLLKITALYSVTAHNLVAKHHQFEVARYLHLHNRYPAGGGRTASPGLYPRGCKFVHCTLWDFVKNQRQSRRSANKCATPYRNRVSLLLSRLCRKQLNL